MSYSNLPEDGSDWQYFNPNDDMGIHGLERILDDGSAIDVLAYGSYDDPGEFSWMIREWDDRQDCYHVTASYDDGVYYDDLESAYDALTEVLENDFSHLIEHDEISFAPREAKTRFLTRLVAIGLAASLAIPILSGFTGLPQSYYQQDQVGAQVESEMIADDETPLAYLRDSSLGSETGEVLYRDLISNQTDLILYDECTEIMCSGANTEIDPDDERGWCRGYGFAREDLNFEMVNYS